ncbi:hypothetical protein SARC_05547 [Sphaeroforma arctica JP610]|uniref:Uncharacterized protein n=1 Tax=Sphaeroforma arctica JP610 TaxID=667725 RepID=A0A0L0G019_9EUKA|nr:hypothetical protein SARC_05547 [Sphaeroforma arctica JP610]KNC82166.1 hypothetical protein SARC_05547 [Sphaeroforma arctica JP610]|eukprot:XP_014156068.1 hypothetical protein SARC_05547 [Sphaeroforma arctica JP610]
MVDGVGELVDYPEDLQGDDGVAEESNRKITDAVKDYTEVNFWYEELGKLSGHTLEKIGRIPIPEQTIQLLGITDPSFTATNVTEEGTGYYEFNNLPFGEYMNAPTIHLFPVKNVH